MPKNCMERTMRQPQTGNFEYSSDELTIVADWKPNVPFGARIKLHFMKHLLAMEKIRWIVIFRRHPRRGMPPRRGYLSSHEARETLYLPTFIPSSSTFFFSNIEFELGAY